MQWERATLLWMGWDKGICLPPRNYSLLPLDGRQRRCWGGFASNCAVAKVIPSCTNCQPTSSSVRAVFGWLARSFPWFFLLGVQFEPRRLSGWKGGTFEWRTRILLFYVMLHGLARRCPVESSQQDLFVLHTMQEVDSRYYDVKMLNAGGSVRLNFGSGISLLQWCT